VSTPEGRVAVRVVIGGRVQGVFFRDSCARRARSEAVDGWIRNRPDGRVEAWFEGRPQAVEKLVGWCRQGPPRAAVTDVAVSPDSPAGLEGFRIQ
jgi:acylphosphatase